MKSVRLGLAALLLASCVAQPDHNDTAASGAADSIATGSPNQAVVSRLIADALRNDGRYDESEIDRLTAFLKGGDAQVKSVLEAIAREDRFATRGALDKLRAALAGGVVGPGLATTVYELREGRDPSFVFDDELHLRSDGRVKGDTGIVGHSRGYAAYQDGVLRFAHGSPAPAYAIDDTAALRRQGPDAALDAAARVYGLDLGGVDYRYFASKVHYRPGADTPYWMGLCHAWTAASLDNRLSALVDVPGREGEVGLWIFGQWISRADLGNWLMGVYDALSIADSVTVDSFVKADNFIKGMILHVMNNGHGLRGDLWNDSDKGRSEVWNQPILSADLEVASVSETTRASVLAWVATDSSRWEPVPADARVRLVKMTGAWGAEMNDAHEGAVYLKRSTWNAYLITDPAGKVARGYMAHHLAKAGVRDLPVTTSDSLPDYFAYPKHAAVDAVLKGVPDRLVDGAFQGKIFRFFVGTVLAHGIPNATRAAFEADVAAGVPGLSPKYPGIANAYSPETWERVFAAKLGKGEDYGAVWGKAARR